MTSQITKDFQMKSKLRKLADGGSPNPSMLGAGAAARAGGLLAGRGRQIDGAVDAAAGAPAPAPQRVAQAPKKSGLRSMFGFADGGSLRPEGITGGTATSIFTPDEMKQFNAMGLEALASGNAEAAQAVGAGRAEAAQAAAAAAREAAQFRGFADGGSYLDDGYNANRYQQSQLRDGGRVSGPGGRTDDKVGPVMLSDEEYVLPGDTADAIGRDKLDAIRLATHEFKDGRKESALRGRADGGNGWYDDMMPMDHLADGGNPWIIDSNGTVRAGGARPTPNLPATRPMGGVPQVGNLPMGQRPPINMGMAEVVEKPGMAGRAYNAGKVVGRVAGTAGRMAGSTAVTAPIAGFGDYKADTGGIDTSAGGTLGYLAKGEFGNAATSLSGGAGEALADSGRGFAKTADWVAGLVGSKPDLTGSYDKMVKDKFGGYLTLRNPENKPEPAKGSAKAATSSLRSDQGPAQPVLPGSYQSRRLSEMGVPLDVQNSKPVVDSVTGNTRDFLRTGGTSQYQNLGTYGGNGNIYGKADDPSRPGRINNFVGVGAGASPSNEVGNTVQSPVTAAITSALRGLGSGSSAPGGNAGASSFDGSGPVDNSAAINARYDKLAEDLRGMYGPKGQGNLARRLLELESSRSNALDANARDATSRSNEAMQSSTLRDNAQLNARTSLIDTLGRMEQNRAIISSQAQAAQLKAWQDAQKINEERDADSVETYKSVADTFAAGDKEKAQRYLEVLSTLGPELDQIAQGLTPTDKYAFYTNILRQQIGRDEGLVLGRDVGAAVQNAAVGGLVGRMSRLGNGAAGKAIDTALGKLPRVGPIISSLRPAENLTRFGTVLGAGAGAALTPEIEEYNRFDPIARDPVSGAALPAREDLREAFTYGAFDTYLNPSNDDVQTVSGRRTDRPNPTEEEAARRFRSTLRTE